MDLRQYTLVMHRVQLIGRLPGAVGSVEQTAIFGVGEQQLHNALAATAYGDVHGRVTSLCLKGHILRQAY